MEEGWARGRGRCGVKAASRGDGDRDVFVWRGVDDRDVFAWRGEGESDAPNGPGVGSDKEGGMRPLVFRLAELLGLCVFVLVPPASGKLICRLGR